MSQGSAAGVVLASGAGTRVGAAVNKVYLPLAGRRLVAWSLAAFARVPGVDVLVLVIRPQDAELADEVCSGVDAAVDIVHGGRSRQESELNALRHLAPRISRGAIDSVLLHDGARPLITPALIGDVLAAARAHGGAIPGLSATDLVSVEGNHLAARPAGALVRVQTPQAFAARPLLAAYERAASEGFEGTDTASCMERFSDVPVRCVPGDASNIKVTYPHDLVVAERILTGVSPAPGSP